MSALPQPRLTPKQYLEIERASDARHEYHDGQMYAMSGASYRHVIITGNLNYELKRALRKGPCDVGATDLRIRVDEDHTYTYPDIVVVCGEPKFADDQKDTVLNPSVIIEVLSPTTEGYDRGRKFGKYRTIDALQEYGLVSQEEARVEIFQRQANGTWLLTESVGLDASCRFESLGCTIALGDVYAKVKLGAEPAA
ncbi:MAG: Uma2 family endonuclease [Acidobacteriota bacterium]